MKKSLLFLLLFLAVTTLKSQVGVNTETPQGVFHIDGQRNTNGNTNVADDVVVTSAGNVGIGTNSPQTKVDIRSTTQGGGFRLQDGSQGNGMVLTSDASGNGKWSAPGFSLFTRIEPNELPVSQGTTAILRNSDGSPYFIEVPSFGTYSFTIGAMLKLTNLNENTVIEYMILQVVPGDDASLWWSLHRFEGSYEIYGQQARRDLETDWRFYLSENISLNSITGNRLYFALQITGTNMPSPIEGTFTIGSTPSCPQCTGGSYVRIN
ncbi:hypothetical protein [Dysgonomonas sp. 520]|uniref:hypothetical protein n=1 Tax=Dysgonomonas sp. 520 TaxID=2302931 RepID=UPI0013D1C0C8|nr:hypothetical protein [Dysgonomonas sp. 520]NDW09526.1 hypothetical protein [Dysgonomonas sp. 520]